jgi:hypothetical protein
MATTARVPRIAQFKRDRQQRFECIPSCNMGTLCLFLTCTGHDGKDMVPPEPLDAEEWVSLAYIRKGTISAPSGRLKIEKWPAQRLDT